jgi:hypothetical protein
VDHPKAVSTRQHGAGASPYFETAYWQRAHRLDRKTRRAE